MPKLVLLPYPHFIRKPKIPEPVSKEDFSKLATKLEAVTRIRLLSPRSKRKLLKQLKKEGKI